MDINTDLMHAFNFTADDLAYNKQGRFSPRQVAQMKANKRIGRVVIFIFSILCAVFGFIVWRPILFGQAGLFDDIFRLIGGGVLAFLALLFLLAFLRSILRSEKPIIIKVEGTVERVFTRQEEDPSPEGGMVTVHYLLIAGKEVRIIKYQAIVILESLFLEGHRYALYQILYRGRGEWTLSAEYLGGLPEA